MSQDVSISDKHENPITDFCMIKRYLGALVIKLNQKNIGSLIITITQIG